MWKYFLFYTFIRYSVHGNGDTNLILPDAAKTSKFNSITNCIIAISDRELFFQPTVAILDQKQGTKENEFINELIDKLMEFNIPQAVEVGVEENSDWYINSLSIAFFEKCGDLYNLDFKRIDNAIKFLAIISDPSSNDCGEQLEDIGELVSRSSITFIIQDFKSDKNKMFTLFPIIDGNTCKEVVDKPMHINTCFNGTLENDEIFPIKNPENLNKCPFKVGMSTRFPFSTIKNKQLLKQYDPVVEVKGSDLEIVKIITEHFNATLELHYIYKKEDNPYKEWEFIEYVLNGSLDACAGGIYRVYGDIVEYSGIYVRQSIFWVYYAERAERSWEILIQKLDNVYLFIVFYITYSFVWYFTSLFDKDAVSLIKTLLYSWGALVGATSLQNARSKKQNLLNLMYSIMCIYLSAYISMQFYSFLTIRAPPRMFKTNSDVMASGRIPYLNNVTKYFITDEKYLKFANSSKDCVSIFECAEKTLLRNGLTIMVQGNFYGLQAVTAVNNEARLLRVTENLLTVFNEMIIRKNSSLVAKFQSVMQRLFEAGITGRLFTEAVGISQVAKANSASTNMITSSYSCQAGCSITLEQFAGVFYAWIVGCMISCFVFIIEISSKHEKITQIL